MRLLLGAISFALMALNMLFWVPLLLAVALIRFILPITPVRRAIAPVLSAIVEAWVGCNSAGMALMHRTRWDVSGFDQLDRASWYMVVANHQSWVDIVVLQRLLNRRIPILKFFLKRELIWVPLMGLAWWALEFPFMWRFSEAYLKKHPDMRGRDQEATRRACAKFSETPTSVMNFLEGTRFTPEKKERQGSPFRYLLKPKSGGIAMALSSMGDKFRAILDVTIVYPDGIPTLWSFLQGKVSRITVRARLVPIPVEILASDYSRDPEARAAFQAWVNRLWQDKDREIEGLLDRT